MGPCECCSVEGFQGTGLCGVIEESSRDSWVAGGSHGEGLSEVTVWFSKDFMTGCGWCEDLGVRGTILCKVVLRSAQLLPFPDL